MSASANDQYEQENNAPVDNDYKNRTGQSQYNVDVQGDDTPVDDPIDPITADSDATLQADESAAMDQSNIISERTRGATKASGTYTEPGDEEGLPSDDGRSSTA